MFATRHTFSEACRYVHLTNMGNVMDCVSVSRTRYACMDLEVTMSASAGQQFAAVPQNPEGVFSYAGGGCSCHWAGQGPFCFKDEGYVSDSAWEHRAQSRSGAVG